MRRFARIAGALALCSLAFYAFTGMPLWAPVADHDVDRGLVIAFLHIGALVAAGFSFIPG